MASIQNPSRSEGSGLSQPVSQQSIFLVRHPSGAHSLKNMGTTSATEAHFVFALGLLLSLNSGFINGLCLSGLLAEEGSYKHGVSAFTGTYTASGLALARGEVGAFGFEFTLILAFIGGAMVAGTMNPRATPHKLVPSYGPAFLLGSLCMIAASVSVVLHPDRRLHLYFAAAANGIQNGMTSTYTANLIRTSHLTGTSTDIGLILGQMLRGNKRSYWKLKVLVGLASFFWMGGYVSFYSASFFLSNSLWFSAGLYLTIGLAHITYVVGTMHVGFFQACVGTWEWERVLERAAAALGGDEERCGGKLCDLTSKQVDQIFDEIDSDGSGTINASKLKEALEKMGTKLTSTNVDAMVAVVDENNDGVVDREEFHTLVGMAALRDKHRRKRGKNVRSMISLRGVRGKKNKPSLPEIGSTSLGLSDRSDPPSGVHIEGDQVTENALISKQQHPLATACVGVDGGNDPDQSAHLSVEEGISELEGDSYRLM